MITWPSLDELCMHLQNQEPRWSEIRRRFEAIACRSRIHLLHQYANVFSEIHLDVAVETIGMTHMKNRLVVPKIDGLCQKTTKEKIFYNVYRRLVIDTKRSGKWEYDGIVYVDTVPVVLEVKLRAWNKGKITYKWEGNHRRTERSSCVKNSLRKEVYDRKLDPVRYLYNCHDIGYIIILSPEQYQRIQRSSDGSIAHNFMQDNGKIVPFYTDRESFRNEVREKLMEYHYPFLES